MLEGLADVAASLRNRKIKFSVIKGAPPQPVVFASKCSCCVVVDCAYTRLLRQWRRDLAQEVSCAVIQVEGEVAVPASLVSSEEEPSAASFRPKQQRWLKQFLVESAETIPVIPSLELDVDAAVLPGAEVCDVENDSEGVLARLEVDRSVPRCTWYLRGGMCEVERRLAAFLSADAASPGSIAGYADFRNDPGRRLQSHLSPYLQYGQVSPVRVAVLALALAARCPARRRDVDAFLEELLVRRELAVNFVLRARANNQGKNPGWTSYEKLRLVIEKKMFSNTEELLPVISFNAKASADEAKKHEDFVTRMVAKGYTSKQVRLLCEWYLRVRKSS